MRILLGEDNRGDAYLVRDALRKSQSPIELECVTDGEQLLAYLRREGAYARASAPDLIVLDLHMPRKDGWAVVEELGTVPGLRDIPVVVFTGTLTPLIEQRLTALGVVRAVQKPLNLEKYIDTINEMVAWWHNRHAPQAR